MFNNKALDGCEMGVTWGVTKHYFVIPFNCYNVIMIVTPYNDDLQ